MFDVNVFPILWDGEPTFAFILNDVSHLETIIRLKVADANKDKVIASISHELRTPINFMLNIVDMIASET